MNFSSFIFPLILTAFSLYVLISKKESQNAFILGANEGIKSAFSLIPTLVLLLTAVSMFTASGAADLLSMLLSPVLSKVGKSNVAYSLLLQTEDPSWLYSVHQGATTVWERWTSYTHERGFGDVNMNSFNHYSFGAVMEWMYSYMAGIRSLGYAFNNVMFAPKPDMRSDGEMPVAQERIDWVKATYKSRHGLISSAWKREGDGFTYECETPVGAEFHLPLDDGKKSFTINGVEKQVSDFMAVDGCAVINLDCGKYNIKY